MIELEAYPGTVASTRRIRIRSTGVARCPPVVQTQFFRQPCRRLIVVVATVVRRHPAPSTTSRRSTAPARSSLGVVRRLSAATGRRLRDVFR